MIVRELIEKLQAAPPDLEVVVEGCDCIEGVSGISVGVINLITEDGAKAKERVIVRQKDGACVWVKEPLAYL